MKSEDDILEAVLEIIGDKGNVPIKFKTLLTKLELKGKNEENMLSNVVEKLINDGTLIKVREGKYSTPQTEGMVVGRFQSNDKGFGFVICDDTNKKDIFIPAKYVRGTLNKDKVICKISRQAGESRLAEGEIFKILERGADLYVGIYQKNKGFGFVVPDSTKIQKDIFISTKNDKGAVSGEKVVVRILKYEEGMKPEGEIVEILGHKDDPGMDVLSIIKEYDVPTEFPEDVIKELEEIPSEVSDTAKIGRADIRTWQTITIDGEDTKDIDDAVTLVKLENGNFKLGVHIADVTNYVKEGSPLDKEALARGNSIYVVDRVIPMLPHKLSNGICSLNQGVDRLALSCIMEIDLSGEVVNYDICETLINVDKRMTYTEVQKGLDKDPKILSEDKDFLEMFANMEELAKILYNKRVKRGALEFISEECKIYLDEKGKPIEIKKYERNTATNIIEEFMLVCNETIAEEYAYLDLPFVFRSHDIPDADKLEYIVNLIREMGIPCKISEEIHPNELQKMLSDISGRQEEKMLSKLMLRSMKQARYTSTNEGHFGLAAKFYCHFTSPIRRYADLTIHRIIKENLNGGIANDRYSKIKIKTIEVSEKTSASERKADEIEREVDEYKKCEYMQDFIDEEFEGTISGITGWGIYVELDNTVEGLIRLTSLKDMYYYDEKRYKLIGNKGKQFTLGDSIKVKLIAVDLRARTIDFEYVEPEE